MVFTYTNAITVNPAATEVYVGDTVTLTATTVPADQAVTWTSENNTIATVDENGVVTGISAGQATITARVDEDTCAECTVTVTAKSIVINSDTYDVTRDGTASLTATTYPADQTVTWTSSNPSVLQHLSGSAFAAVKAGTVTVTATLADGTSDTCTVHVVLPNGVYRIKNNLSNLYLSSASGVKDGTTVKQYALVSLSEDKLGYYAQLWNIQYLGSGYYTLRPMHFLTSGLSGKNANAAIYGIGTESTLTAVSTTERWTIDYISGGYVVKCNGNINKTLQIPYNSTDSGTSATLSYFTQSTPADRWQIEEAETIADTLLLFDLNSGKLDSMPQSYIAPEETRTVEDIGFVASFVSDSNNIIVASCGISGTAGNISYDVTTKTVTGLNPETQGALNFYVHNKGVLHSQIIYVNVTAVAEGTYFMRNKQTSYYADIESQIMEDGRTIHQWEFHGGDTQKWTFTHLGDGTYSIHSQNASTKYYLGVSGDSSEVDLPIVLRTGTITSGMKWTVEKTANDAYKLIPKSGKATGCVLATSTSSATNGAILVQGDYIDNNSYRDEWLLSTVYTLSLNIYYDYAFAARYSSEETLLNSFQPQANEIFGEVFGLCLTWNTPQKIYSTPDLCKLNRDIGINANTVDAMCPANPTMDVPYCNYYNNVNYYEHASNPMSQYYPCTNCTSYYQIYHDFIKTHPGNDVSASVLFTGNALYDDEGELCDRCYKWYNSGLLMLDNSSSTEEYYDEEFLAFVHELSHIIGAKDHYHSVRTDENGNEYCVNKENCYLCMGESGRPMWCIMDMGMFYNSPDDVNTDRLYCSGCIEEISEHLDSHHKNG